MFKYFPGLVMAVALSACGGGGGTTAAVADPTPAQVVVSPATTFLPAKLTNSAVAGTSSALTVTATVVRPADFAPSASVHAFIVDVAGVLLPTTQITRTSATEFSATLYTAATLTPATYKGNFTLKLCQDAACATQFPGSPVQLPYELTVTAPALPQITASSNLPLFASARLGAPATVNALVTVKAEGRNWTAISSAPWLKLTAAAGTGNGSFNVGTDATGMPVGKYDATVTVTSNDGQSAVLPAQLSVLEAAFVIEGNNVFFNAINGAPIPVRSLKFALDNEVASDWKASSDSGWLNVSPTSGVTPAIATLAVNPSASNLPSGRYDALLTLSSPLTRARTVNVALNLSPATLSLANNSVTLGGTTGRTFSSVTLPISLNTQENRWPWTLSAAPAWLKPDAVSGSIDQGGTNIVFTAAAAAAPVGTSTVVLSVGAKVNGDVLKQPLSVTINKDQRKLLAAETGVALSSTPGWSRLSRTIQISDNFGLDDAWSASSDQPWLSVTASGRTTSGVGTLALSANAASLPNNQVSYATVTLASSADGVTVPETIRVALWKGTVTPTSAIRLPLTYTNVVADPVRPFAYVHSGATSIDAYNVYTGVKIGSIAGLGAALGDMAISPNGDSLYVFDTANRNIVVVDLATMTKKTTWALAASANSDARLLAMHPNGVNIVVTNGGSAYLAPSGKVVAGGPTGGEIAASGDGRRLFAANSLRGYTVDYSEISDGLLMIANYANNYANGTIIASNADGSRVYLANGYSYRCTAFQGSDLTEIGALPGSTDSYNYMNNVKVASDGRVFCSQNGYYSNDLWVNRPDSTLQGSFKVAGTYRSILQRQLVVSGDALMVVALTDDPALVFFPVGP